MKLKQKHQHAPHSSPHLRDVVHGDGNRDGDARVGVSKGAHKGGQALGEVVDGNGERTQQACT